MARNGAAGRFKEVRAVSSYAMEVEDFLKLREQENASLTEELALMRRRLESALKRAESAEEQRNRLLTACDEYRKREKAFEIARELERQAGL
jgi:aminopeptidase N